MMFVYTIDPLSYTANGCRLSTKRAERYEFEGDSLSLSPSRGEEHGT